MTVSTFAVYIGIIHTMRRHMQQSFTEKGAGQCHSAQKWPVQDGKCAYEKSKRIAAHHTSRDVGGCNSVERGCLSKSLWWRDKHNHSLVLQ